MIKKIIILSLLTISFSAQSAEMCEVESSITEVKSQIHDLQNMMCLPKISYIYSRGADCGYNLGVTIDIPSNIPSAQDFLMNKMMNPSVNLASADRSMMLAYSLKSKGLSQKKEPIFEQIVKGKKSGVSMNVYSSCVNRGNPTQSTMICVTDAKRSAVLFVHPIAYSTTSVTCINLNASTKRCVVNNAAKLNDLPLGKGKSCELAPKAAAQGIMAFYRLAHFITHGHAEGLERGSKMVEKFRKSVARNPARASDQD